MRIVNALADDDLLRRKRLRRCHRDVVRPVHLVGRVCKHIVRSIPSDANVVGCVGNDIVRAIRCAQVP